MILIDSYRNSFDTLYGIRAIFLEESLNTSNRTHLELWRRSRLEEQSYFSATWYNIAFDFLTYWQDFICDVRDIDTDYYWIQLLIWRLLKMFVNISLPWFSGNSVPFSFTIIISFRLNIVSLFWVESIVIKGDRHFRMVHYTLLLTWSVRMYEKYFFIVIFINLRKSD